MKAALPGRRAQEAKIAILIRDYYAKPDHPIYKRGWIIGATVSYGRKSAPLPKSSQPESKPEGMVIPDFLKNAQAAADRLHGKAKSPKD